MQRWTAACTCTDPQQIAGRHGLVAVLGAKHAEVAPIVRALERPRQQALPGLIVWTGTISGQPVAVAEHGSGKTNAAVAAGWLIFGLRATFAISVGTCGALVPAVTAGDLIVSSRSIVHDYGIRSGTGFTHRGSLGLILDGREHRFATFDGDTRAGQRAATELRRHSCVVEGIVASGDTFVSDPAERARIADVHDAVAVDMTTSGIAATCTTAEVPWIAVRCASDHADHRAADHYSRHHSNAAGRAAEAVVRLLTAEAGFR